MIKRLLILSLFIFSIFFFVPSKVNAQTCTPPATATGVTVEYPGCPTGTTCDLAQASCSWNSQSDAASYNITVTEVETGTIIKNNESQPSSTTKVLFPITQKRTYKCDVVAVSSCGGLAAAATDQLLCEADALIDTPTPVPPTPTPIPPTKPPPPKAGASYGAIALLGGVIVMVVGGVLLFIL